MEKGLISLLVLFLVVGGVCADVGEIQYQTVKYGDYVMQYAVVQVINNQGEKLGYKKYCDDCVCSLSVYNPDASYIFKNRATQLISAGLYGYKAEQNEFDINTMYTAEFYCVSPVYGNGSVSSGFMVKASDSLASPPVTGDAAPVDPVDIIVQPIKDLGSYLWGLVSDTFGLSGWNTNIKEFTDFAASILKDAVALGKIPLGLIKFMVKFILDPYPYNVFSDEVLPYILDVFWSVIVLYIIWNILAEVVIIGYAVVNNKDRNILTIMADVFMLHINLVKYVFVFAYSIILGVMNIFTGIIKLLSFVRQIFQV